MSRLLTPAEAVRRDAEQIAQAAARAASASCVERLAEELAHGVAACAEAQGLDMDLLAEMPSVLEAWVTFTCGAIAEKALELPPRTLSEDVVRELFARRRVARELALDAELFVAMANGLAAVARAQELACSALITARNEARRRP